MKFLSAVAVFVALICLAAPAQADSTDDGFLVSLKAAGLTYEDPGKAIAAGKSVCELAGGGKAMPDIVKQVQELNPGLQGDHAAKFTAISVSSYCPKAMSGA